MRIIKRMAYWLRRDDQQEALREELALHRELVERDLVAQGMTPAAARDEARRVMGNETYMRGEARGIWIGGLESLSADLRLALRALRRSPVFAVAAVGSIALGIGANGAIFSLIDAVALRSLPVPHPEELMQVGAAHKGEGGFVGVARDDQRFSNPLWEALRDRPNGFASLAAFSNFRANLADEAEARFAIGSFVSGDYFRLFGVRPEIGRLISTSDDVHGCAPVVVLGRALWTTEFAGDPGVIGRNLSLDGVAFRIIGVAAGKFSGPVAGMMPRFFAPLCAEPVLRGAQARFDDRTSWWLTVIGRRPAEADPRRIGAMLEAIAPEAHATTLPIGIGTAQRNSYLSHTFSAGDASRGISDLSDRFRRPLLVLMGFVLVLMLIACANVANLQLARASARRHELAVRVALGAGRARLMRQLLTESVLLALLGAVIGLLLAHAGASALVGMISLPGAPVELDLSLDWRLIGFISLASAVAVCLFGVLPAFRSVRIAPYAAMAGAFGRTVGESHSRFRFGRTIVVAQVALSLVVLVGAGLFLGSLRKLWTKDPGFRAEGVLIVRADLSRTGLAKEQRAALRDELTAALRAIPGVADASQSYLVPVGGNRWNDVIAVEGFTARDPDDEQIWFNRVGPRYFATLGTRVLAGREFDAQDVPAAARAVIVNESFARRFFRTMNVIGRTFHTRVRDTLSAPLTIVGLVADTRYQSLRDVPEPIAYVAMSQGSPPGQTMNVELRTAGAPLALVPAVRSAIARVNPRVLVEPQAMTDQLAASLTRERLLAVLSGTFGAVAVFLATLGLYGLMAYSVTRRTNEIGVRQALGADRGRILRFVLGDVGRLLAAGLLLGAVIAAWTSRLTSSMLFGMESATPAMVSLAAIVLILTGTAAGLIPAWRASRIDPVTALRSPGS